MKLLRKRVFKNGKRYIDFYLEWEYNGKTKTVRIEPTFMEAFSVLYAEAKEV